MGLQSTLLVQWNDGSEIVSAPTTVTDDGIMKLDIAVADGQTDLVVDFALPIADIKNLLITADGILTLKTNATGGGAAQTFVFAAGNKIVWDTSFLNANPITTGITSLHLANSSGVTVNLKVRVATHPG